MTKINSVAVMFWVFCSGVGYLADGNHGAIVGAVVGIGISLLISVFQ